jgi:transposase-like protein
MTKVEQQIEWMAKVTAYKASGLSTKEWCSAHNLKPHQLRYWLRKLQPLDSQTIEPTRWLPVEFSDPEPKNQVSTLLIRVGQATVEVKPGFDPTLLSDIVRVLSVLC